MRLSLLTFLLGCILYGQTRLPPPVSHERAKQAAAPSHTRKGGPAASASDAEIERIFREKLAKSKIASDRFKIHVQGGVATLEGQTDVTKHKGTATRMAKSAGAKAVVNKIKVSDAAKEKAAANLEKGRRRAQVKRSEVAGR